MRAVLIALALLVVLVGTVFALTRGGDEADPAAAPDTSTSETSTSETAEADPSAGDSEVAEPGIDLPQLPSDLPDLPDLSGLPTEIPDLPEIPQDTQDDARNLWEQFTDWFSSLF